MVLIQENQDFIITSKNISLEGFLPTSIISESQENKTLENILILLLNTHHSLCIQVV